MFRGILLKSTIGKKKKKSLTSYFPCVNAFPRDKRSRRNSRILPLSFLGRLKSINRRFDIYQSFIEVDAYKEGLAYYSKELFIHSLLYIRLYLMLSLLSLLRGALKKSLMYLLIVSPAIKKRKEERKGRRRRRSCHLSLSLFLFFCSFVPIKIKPDPEEISQFIRCRDKRHICINFFFFSRTIESSSKSLSRLYH